jgi:hypothetical protein
MDIKRRHRVYRKEGLMVRKRRRKKCPHPTLAFVHFQRERWSHFD